MFLSNNFHFWDFGAFQTLVNWLKISNIKMSFSYQTRSKSVVASPNKSRGNKEDFRTKYKTEKCKFYELGNCRYGDKCAFAHGD